MADEKQSNIDENHESPKLNKFSVVIVGVIVLLIIWGFWGGNDEADVRDENSGYDPGQAAKVEREQRQKLLDLEEWKENLNVGNTSGIDPFAAVSSLSRRVEMQSQELNRVMSDLEKKTLTTDQVKRLEGQVKDIQDQIKSLSESMQRQMEQTRLAERDDSRRANVPDFTNESDLVLDLGTSKSDMQGGFLIEDESAPDKKAEAPIRRSHSPYGENYIVLSKRTPQVPGVNSPQNPFDAAPGTATVSNSARDRSSSGQSNNSVSESSATTLTPEYGEYADRGKAHESTGDDDIQAEDAEDILDIPAYSFVDAVTMHGVDCAVGGVPLGSDSSAGGSSPIHATPIVLPVRGTIKGPNGKRVDIGTAHLQGWCFGKVVDRGENGRALIKIESISYWDRKGESQFLDNISGMVVSLKDNHAGILAPVDEVRRSYIGEQAGAAALAAAAAGVNEAQYEEVRTDEGHVQRLLSGNKGITYGAKGASTAFQLVANLINEEAERAYDAVRVNPGEPVKVVFMRPLKLKNTKQNVEGQISDSSDLLL